MHCKCRLAQYRLSAAMRYAMGLSRGVQSLLEGCSDPDPAQHGLTTDEERAAARFPGWPGVVGAAVVPPNAGLKLFGGAAFERCLHEFQEAANCLRFPASKCCEDSALAWACRMLGAVKNACCLLILNNHAQADIALDFRNKNRLIFPVATLVDPHCGICALSYSMQQVWPRIVWPICCWLTRAEARRLPQLVQQKTSPDRRESVFQKLGR
jgi:hypothetical protein